MAMSTFARLYSFRKSLPDPESARSKWIWLCVALLTAGGMFCPHATAQSAVSVLKPLTDTETAEPWKLEADRIRYDRKTNRYIATGNVAIQKGDALLLLADEIRFDQSTMQATASGNIAARIGSDELTAQKVDLDLNSQTGTLYDARLFLRENNFHISGDRIEKKGPDRYIVQNPSVTTCDGETPDWQISGNHLDVTVEGYGYVRGAAFKARGIPFLYAPWLAFPAKLKRQSGLLAPEFGSSSRKGYYIVQPLFWAVSDSVDATFYAHYMSLRGIKLGTEFRYAAGENTAGAWMADYLYDRQIDDGTENSSDEWGYTDDDLLRTNRDRYWIRGSHLQALPLDVFGRLDLDIVSDQDYLAEFRSGLTGFYDTRRYYNDQFNRELADYSDPFRKNQLHFNRLWQRFNLNADARYYDNAESRNSDAPNDTLQRLPVVDFDASKQQMFNLPAFFDFNTNYNYFYRQEGDRGHRLDIHPRLFAPVRLGRFATLEPSVALRETAWYLRPGDLSAEASESSRSEHRELYDVGVSLASQIHKVFGPQRPAAVAVRHILEPQIAYTYVPDEDQSELPYFDAVDRIAAQNRLTYSVTNFVILRRPDMAPDDADGRKRAGVSYHQTGRFKLEQSYDIAEAMEDDLPPDQKRRPFSPIRAELDIDLTDRFIVKSDADWDVYQHRFDSGNVAVALMDDRRDRLFAEYRYTRYQTESIFADLLINLNRRWALEGEYEYNLLDDERLKTAAGILYDGSCWATAVKYTNTPSEQRYEIRISLKGLGDFGYTY